MLEDNNMLFIRFQGKNKKLLPKNPTLHQCLVPVWKCKKSNMQDCKRILTIYHSWIKKKILFKDIYQNTKGSAKHKDKIIVVNSACYMLDTLLRLIIIHLNTSVQTIDVATIIIPHFQWGKWNIERFTFLLKIIQQIRGGARIWTLSFWPQTSHS